MMEKCELFFVVLWGEKLLNYGTQITETTFGS